MFKPKCLRFSVEYFILLSLHATYRTRGMRIRDSESNFTHLPASTVNRPSRRIRHSGVLAKFGDARRVQTP